MNADPNKNNRRRTVKTRSRFTTLLTVYFFVALIIPNCVLANTEPYSVWTVEALILMPLGFYMMWSVALRRSGIMIWLAFPFIFLCAFQIVLLYLFGGPLLSPMFAGAAMSLSSVCVVGNALRLGTAKL